jgi:hypothetical protein
VTAVSGSLTLEDDEQIRCGDATDATLAWVGAANEWLFDNANITGPTAFRLGTDTSATAWQVRNDSDSNLFEVQGDGQIICSGNLRVNDDLPIQVGTDDDFTITHANATDDVSFTSVNANAKLIWQLGSSNATSDFRIQESGGNIVFRVDGAERIGFFNTAPTGQSAAYTPSNVTAVRAYDANATSIDELADVLGTLIADLKLTGLLG